MYIGGGSGFVKKEKLLQRGEDDGRLVILFMRGTPLFIYNNLTSLAKNGRHLLNTWPMLKTKNIVAYLYFFGQKWPTPTLQLAFLHLADAKNKKLSGLSLLLTDTLTIYFTTFI